MKILVVEDEGIVAKDIQNRLKALGYDVPVTASTGMEAIRQAETTQPDLVLMDIVLKGDMTGVDAAEIICKKMKIPVIYLTAYSDNATLEKAKITEPYGYILKPFEERDLHTTIEMAIYKHKTEKKLRDDERWLQTTLRSIGDAVITTDMNGLINFMNLTAESLTGWQQEEALGQEFSQIFQIFGEGDKEPLENRISRVIQESVPIGISNHKILVSKNGTKIPIDDNAAPIKDEEGIATGMVLVFRDVTERKLTADALAAEKERLAITLRSIADGVITTDIGGNVILINRVAENLTGWRNEDAEGQPISKVYKIVDEKNQQPFDPPISKVLETGDLVNFSKRFILKSRNGVDRIISNSAAPICDAESNMIGVVLVFQDITERTTLEAELLKAQKLESIGVLAGGIAHDFNNILTGILGNISLVKLGSDPDDSEYPRLIEAEKACLRAKNLTQQLLTFARGGAPVKVAASITDLINESAVFALRGSNVRSRVIVVPDKVWSAEIDLGQISQVMHNLILNADQAMPNGGAIEITLDNIEYGPSKNSPLPIGRYVKISVCDQGVGIPKEHISKIFDPYFSTKQKGSGLGLAICYSIVKNHQGLITVNSETGSGTTFELFLPATSKEVSIRGTTNESLLALGKGRVLVMDDEDIVLDVVSEMLPKLGYQPVTVKTGEEAFETYKKAMESGHRFAAVIMDLTIPGGMGGKETVQKLLAIDTKVKAIVSSGYSNDPIMADYKKYGFCNMIIKPYRVYEISQILHSALN